ncbi:alkaline shock response membrane anchor protein AmaP [Streptococcus ruminantium]|uniref:alkaline shock response membrane anchor protein AmaP n=1 Tax=Streptococcus ruminantium TaxID=1917441 RepID=UPI0012DF5B88|nr:alkaline shock response membrane anchor protein AmaP [Streptococcus ruminantium]
MNRVKKISFVSFGFLLSLLVGILALMTVDKVRFPDQVSNLITSLYLKPALQSTLAPYIFWTATAVLIFLLMFILVVIFYPRLYTEVELEDTESGRLEIKKDAIESYIRTLIQEEGIMPSPAVKVKMFRNRFKVYASGRIVPKVDVPAKLAALEKEIRAGLEQFFGIAKKLDYHVAVTHIEPKQKGTSSRVE